MDNSSFLENYLRQLGGELGELGEPGEQRNRGTEELGEQGELETEELGELSQSIGKGWWAPWKTVPPRRHIGQGNCLSGYLTR